MSFTNTVTAPRSTQIALNFLKSIDTLGKIETKLQTKLDDDEKLAKYIPKLQDIIKSFNQSAEFINTQVQLLNFQFPSYADYCKNKTFETEEAALEQYNLEKTPYDSQMLELDQLKELGYYGPTLSGKIESVYNKLKTFNSITEQVLPYELEKLDRPSNTPKPQLVIFDDAESEYSSSSESEDEIMHASLSSSLMILKNESSSTSDETITALQFLSESVTIAHAERLHTQTITLSQNSTKIVFEEITTPSSVTEIAESTPSIPTHFEVTISCNLDSEQTLGMCCAPNWDKEPISFRKNENGWSVKVPFGTEWKYVILMENRIFKWENGKDRFCENDQVQANELKPRFS